MHGDPGVRSLLFGIEFTLLAIVALLASGESGKVAAVALGVLGFLIAFSGLVEKPSTDEVKAPDA